MLLALLPLLACLGPAGCGEEGDAPSPVASVPIEIRIDHLGIPHIYGATDELAFYGAGYQMAADRLYQMATLRRFALGRLSEVIGEAGLERDLQARTFDFPRWGRRDAALMETADPERAALLRAWVRGINHRIREVRSGAVPLPFGFGPEAHDFLPEPWDETDPYVVLKGAGFALDKTVEFEVALTILSLLYPEPMAAVQVFRPAHPVYGMPPEDRPTANTRRAGLSPPPTGSSQVRAGGGLREMARCKARDVLTNEAYSSERRGGEGRAQRRRWPFLASLRPGSNNWAIDGRFTADGRPLIAGDPHLSFDFFGAPYPMHINSKRAGGTYDVAGFAYPGTPGIALGQTDRVVWTATSAFADVNDVWNIIRWGSGRILVGEGVVPVRRREETIIVRDPGAPAGQGHPVTLVYEDVEGYGVILPQEIVGIPVGGPFLMNWTGFTARPARWFMELDRVDSLDAFEAAVDRMREMNYSFIAADASGIAYRVGVDVPRRLDTTGDRAPWRAMRSWDPGSLWTGEMLPRSHMPRSRALERGWLATANNDPFGFTGDGRTDNDPWYYGAFFAPGYRARRIADRIEALTERGGLTVEDMKTLQRDLRSTLADDLLPLLAAAHGRIGTDEALARFRDRPDLDRVVALLTETWDRRMARDAAGALAFHAFLHFTAAGAVRDDIPLAYDFAMGLQTIFVVKVAAMALGGAYPDGDRVLQEGRDVILLDAAARTADWLRSAFGTVDPRRYTYADRKATSFDGAFGFDMPVFERPTDGGEDTINVSQNISFSETADAWITRYVSVERTVGGFGADGVPVLHVNYPVGGHADPASEETRSANDDYVEGRYRKLPFRRAEVEAATVRRFVLRPE